MDQNSLARKDEQHNGSESKSNGIVITTYWDRRGFSTSWIGRFFTQSLKHVRFSPSCKIKNLVQDLLKVILMWCKENMKSPVIFKSK